MKDTVTPIVWLIFMAYLFIYLFTHNPLEPCQLLLGWRDALFWTSKSRFTSIIKLWIFHNNSFWKKIVIYTWDGLRLSKLWDHFHLYWNNCLCHNLYQPILDIWL